MRSLLGESWVSASVALVIVGLLAQSVPVVGLGVLVFATGGVARMWARVSLEGVRYTRALAERRVFVGEAVGLRLRLANEKRLPVPWLEVRDQLPAEAPVLDAHTQPSGLPGSVYLTRSASLGGGERLEWPLTLQASERGFYRIGPARLRSGDIFGLFERESTVRGSDSLVVYPRTVPLADLGLPSARPFGEQRGGDRIYEDPVRVVGVRDYVPGDPLKRVDWKASARLGRLQSRLFEPSRTQSVVVALNISTMEHSWQGFDPLLLERGVMVAASVARQAFEEGSAVGLVANGSFPDADRPIRIGSGRSPDQLVHVLEALAMIAPFTTSRLADELEARGQALPVGATVVVVAALMPPELVGALHRLRGDGHAVHVLKTSAHEWEPLGAIALTDLDAPMRAIEAEFEPAATTQAVGRRASVVRA